jgi:hypothetical protein
VFRPIRRIEIKWVWGVGLEDCAWWLGVLNVIIVWLRLKYCRLFDRLWYNHVSLWSRFETKSYC